MNWHLNTNGVWINDVENIYYEHQQIDFYILAILLYYIGRTFDFRWNSRDVLWNDTTYAWDEASTVLNVSDWKESLDQEWNTTPNTTYSINNQMIWNERKESKYYQ